MDEQERRGVDGVEVRFLAVEGKVGTLSGYAAVFDSLSVEISAGGRRFRERIAPGAFRSALASGGNVFAYYHHQANTLPLGSTRDGSLRVREDSRGLAFELDLPDTTAGRDLAETVKRGTVQGASFSFKARSVRDAWHVDGGMPVRTLLEVRDLVDVSPTHVPAYVDTALALRSMQAWEARESRSFSAAGEMSYEERQAAIYAALKLTLGDRWSGAGGEGWDVMATFDSSVVVQRGFKFFSYPVTWAGGKPSIGEPAQVEQVYRSEDAEPSDRHRRLRVAEAELGLTDSK